MFSIFRVIGIEVIIHIVSQIIVWGTVAPIITVGPTSIVGARRVIWVAERKAPLVEECFRGILNDVGWNGRAHGTPSG
jgi:hypothetical protein